MSIRYQLKFIASKKLSGSQDEIFFHLDERKGEESIRKNGHATDRVGFGGAEIGYEKASASTSKELLNTALDGGLNDIDTGECYVNSEELIGAAIAGGDCYLFTKCGHPQCWGREDWIPDCRDSETQKILREGSDAGDGSASR